MCQKDYETEWPETKKEHVKMTGICAECRRTASEGRDGSFLFVSFTGMGMAAGEGRTTTCQAQLLLLNTVVAPKAAFFKLFSSRDHFY
jgi:hypothetical protein